MPTDELDDLHGETLSNAERDAFLEASGVGVLALADGDDAYGLPISYGYDGEAERLFFVFLKPGAESRKEAYAEATDSASFVVYDVDSEHEWTSVVLDGELRPVDEHEWDDLSTVLERNAWYPDLFSAADPDRGIDGWELVIENASGRTSE
ncbi:MAG: nitroimidazol reductase NimA-like FMN-containing flavoprotein [Natronomonas sp.]|jgi:nitroimidazol reductase NimA-like FMN-containing flavoprotein (pyridoxamine 5'-phosphate oxidase superfamily)|uniref:pyridoxamine 5'-phosphate oxidase family protein n=1 Tax=Natronomonas sp. TaxID=2184060 RepID=UPI003989E6F8